MANTKMTQKEMFKAIIEVAKEIDRQDIVEFCEGRIEALNRKSANRKTKINEADEELKTAIMEVLASGERLTVSEIMRNSDVLSALSNQKVSALLRKLIAEEKVDKVKEKKSSLFFAVTEQE